MVATGSKAYVYKTGSKSPIHQNDEIHTSKIDSKKADTTLTVTSFGLGVKTFTPTIFKIQRAIPQKPVMHDLIAMWSRLIKNSQNLLKICGSLMAKFWMSMLKSTTKIELHPRNEK